ncbi:MAG: biotin/lipoyl-binding protein [Anaerolineaceae bacterium]|nr:MAG: biotin/lipoyl-binding protein [Anaerolineaceae bacterium]
MIYQHGEQTHDVRLEPRPDGTFIAHIDGETRHVRITQLADGGLFIKALDADSGAVAYTARDDSARYAHVNGQDYTLSVMTGGRRRSSAAGSGDLTAQMPGQVVDVLVNAGDRVAAGQTLLILEAMKMEMRVTAPDDGTVTAVSVQTGDVVARGQQLIDFSAG